MEIGTDSFISAVTQDPSSRALEPAKHLHKLLEALALAEKVGFDAVGIV